MNFLGFVEALSGSKISEQREIEKKLEASIQGFRSIETARVSIPLGEGGSGKPFWANNEAKVVSVEVLLKLKKRRRLTLDEYRGIYNLVASTLGSGSLIVQPVLRDEDGFEWTEDGPQAVGFYQAAARENEIMDRLKTRWSKEVQWTSVHVSTKDASCELVGKQRDSIAGLSSKIRADLMSLLGDSCAMARLTLHSPAKLHAEEKTPWLLWLERAAFLWLGIGVCGFTFLWMRNEKRRNSVESVLDKDAIILTKMVERDPDQAAKWMVRSLLNQSNSEKNDAKKDSQIFDQPS